MEDFYKNYEENDFNTNEIDDSNISIKGLESLLSIPMDLSMELIAEWKRKGKLILDPNFQRREVWNIKQMSQFIESLILGIPIPSVLLADDMTLVDDTLWAQLDAYGTKRGQIAHTTKKQVRRFEEEKVSINNIIKDLEELDKLFEKTK